MPSPATPRIVHAVLPWHPTPFETPLVIVPPLLAVGFLFVAGFNSGLPWPVFVIFGVMALFFVVPFGVFFLTARGRLWTPRPTAVRTSRLGVVGEQAIETLTREIGLRRSVFGSLRRLWTWDEFADGCGKHGIERPTTVIDTALVERLAKIERPPHALEPESIVGSTPHRRITRRLLPVAFIMMAIYMFTAGHPLAAAVSVVVAVSATVAAIPSLRDRVRAISPEQWSTLAGLGAVRDRRGRVWTVDDAVLVIQTRELFGPLFVRLIGAAGELRLGFADESDPDFIALWQRWNHPTPRPELLKDDDGLGGTRMSPGESL